EGGNPEIGLPLKLALMKFLGALRFLAAPQPTANPYAGERQTHQAHQRERRWLRTGLKRRRIAIPAVLQCDISLAIKHNGTRLDVQDGGTLAWINVRSIEMESNAVRCGRIYATRVCPCGAAVIIHRDLGTRVCL